jgi:DNA-binding MarR family transcriptional regulator
MSYTKAGNAFTQLILETFRFNGRLLAAGDRLTWPFKLTSARWQVLGAILRKPLPVAQIARNMGLTRQSVQRLTDNLEKAGFLDYAPNPDHGRAKLVLLNKKGHRTMKALTQSQIRWANEIASDASSGEIESALELMRKLRLRLEADQQRGHVV